MNVAKRYHWGEYALGGGFAYFDEEGDGLMIPPEIVVDAQDYDALMHKFQSLVTTLGHIQILAHRTRPDGAIYFDIVAKALKAVS